MRSLLKNRNYNEEQFNFNYKTNLFFIQKDYFKKRLCLGKDDNLLTHIMQLPVPPPTRVAVDKFILVNVVDSTTNKVS